MASAFIQEATSTTNTITIATPAAGSCLVLCANSTGGAVSAVSGGGVTWALGKSVTSGPTKTCDIWYGLNSSGSGTSITVTGGFTGLARNVSEYSGVKTSGALDVTNSGGGTSTTPAPGSVTPTGNASSLIIAAAGATMGTYSSGPTSMTGLTRVTSGGDLLMPAYAVAQTGALATDWTLSSSVQWGAAVIVLLEATAEEIMLNHNMFHCIGDQGTRVSQNRMPSRMGSVMQSGIFVGQAAEDELMMSRGFISMP